MTTDQPNRSLFESYAAAAASTVRTTSIRWHPVGRRMAVIQRPGTDKRGNRVLQPRLVVGPRYFETASLTRLTVKYSSAELNYAFEMHAADPDRCNDGFKDVDGSWISFGSLSREREILTQQRPSLGSRDDASGEWTSALPSSAKKRRPLPLGVAGFLREGGWHTQTVRRSSKWPLNADERETGAGILATYGEPNETIAGVLKISPKTVESYRLVGLSREIRNGLRAVAVEMALTQGFSQAAVARALDCSQSAVSKLVGSLPQKMATDGVRALTDLWQKWPEEERPAFAYAILDAALATQAPV